MHTSTLHYIVQFYILSFNWFSVLYQNVYSLKLHIFWGVIERIVMVVFSDLQLRKINVIEK